MEELYGIMRDLLENLMKELRAAIARMDSYLAENAKKR